MASSFPQTLGYHGTINTPTLDPTQNQSLLQRLLAQMGQTGSPAPGLSGGSGIQQAGNAGISTASPTMPPRTGLTPSPSGNAPGQTWPTATQAAQDQTAGNPSEGDNSSAGLAALQNMTSSLRGKPDPSIYGTPPTSGGGSGSTAGLDPNNPIDAVFIKNGYKDNGIGSGFGDLSYWRQHPDQAARLDADQRGVGTDTPGPGDVGNTSHGSGGGGTSSGSGAGGMLDLTGSNLLQQALGAQGNDPSNSILARIMAALQQYQGNG